MIYGEPNDTMFNDYPPGHPAGTDEFVSGGAVLSGRGMGTGGVLGTRARVTEASTHPDDAPTADAARTGPTVLIAIDGKSLSGRVVRTAHRLFGEDASYLAINVGPGPYTQMSWAYVWPVAVIVPVANHGERTSCRSPGRRPPCGPRGLTTPSWRGSTPEWRTPRPKQARSCMMPDSRRRPRSAMSATPRPPSSGRPIIITLTWWSSVPTFAAG